MYLVVKQLVFANLFIKYCYLHFNLAPCIDTKDPLPNFQLYIYIPKLQQPKSLPSLPWLHFHHHQQPVAENQYS